MNVICRQLLGSRPSYYKLTSIQILTFLSTISPNNERVGERLSAPIRSHLHPDYRANHIPSHQSPGSRLRVSTKDGLIANLGIEKSGDGNDNIRRAQQATFKVITAPVKDKEVNNEGADE